MKTIPRLLVAAAMATTAFAASGELRTSAQKLSESHKDAIVWLSVLAKTTVSVEGKQAPPQEKEDKSEITGTVVDESGLIVTALGGIDKAAMVNGQMVDTQMGRVKLNAVSEIKDLRVITSDGTEVPADLVMKDADLGLAFIKVRMDSDEAKGVKFSAIDLNDSAKGEILDDCIGLGRLDQSLNREPSVITSEITGITTRPRVFYRVVTDAIGCPVFLSSGKLLGISVVRQPKGGAGGPGGQFAMSPVILPAADVAKVAAQAKDAKPEPKPAAAPEEKKTDEPVKKAGE
jgi:S1-C subfamily serine protease